MPPKVVPSKKSKTASAAAVGVIKAKCVDNQSIVDQLFSIKLRIMKHTPNSNYYFTIVRAIDSTKQHLIPIRTYQDFIALKYVGPSIAQQITFPTQVETGTVATNDDTSSDAVSNVNADSIATAAVTKKPSKRTKTVPTETSNHNNKKRPKRPLPVVPSQLECEVDHSDASISHSQSHSHAQPPPPPMSQAPPPPKRSRPNNNTNTSTNQTSEKGKKQIAYEQAVHASKTWKEQVQKLYEHNQQSMTAVQQYQHLSRLESNGIPTTPTCRLEIQWRVVLLIDIREQWCDYIQAKCTMSGIPCESRQLPIGDMMWIVQGCIPNAKYHPNPHHQDSNTTDNGTNEPKQLVVVEFVAGTILERKTPEDLKSSIFGTRYMEQRLRLQHCGIPQIIYLMEGDIHRELYACPVSTIQTAIWETRILMNFHVVHTHHADDTVITLKRYHRRILQRTFPRAFGNSSRTNTTTTNNTTEALPTFHEAHRNSHRHRRRSSVSSNGNSNSNNTTANENQQQQQQQANRRRLRQRRQSLSELTFDMEPTVPFNMERFISYNELCCKIQYDREIGRQSVHHLYTAMLKQVSTIYNSTKCTTITNQYPTIHDLCASYYESIRTNHRNRIQPVVDNTSKYPSAQYMVTNLPLVKDNDPNDDPNLPTTTTTTAGTTRRIVGTKQKTLGHRSSNELYIAYTGGDTYLNECTQQNPNPFERAILSTATTTGRSGTIPASHRTDGPQSPTTTTTTAAVSASTRTIITTTAAAAAMPLQSSSPSTSIHNIDQGQEVVSRNNISSHGHRPQETITFDWESTKSMNDGLVTSSLVWNDEIILLDDDEEENNGCCSTIHNKKKTTNVSLNIENHHPNRNETKIRSSNSKATLYKKYSSTTMDSDDDDDDDDELVSSRFPSNAMTEAPQMKHASYHPNHFDSDDDDDSVLDLFRIESTRRVRNHHPPTSTTSSLLSSTTMTMTTTTTNTNRIHRYPLEEPEIIVLD